jgi:hypothetical protein
MTYQPPIVSIRVTIFGTALDPSFADIAFLTPTAFGSSVVDAWCADIDTLIDVVSQGNLERVRIIREFNLVFNEAYLGGDIERHCTVTTSPGNPEFSHELSTFYLRSGFKITIENDNNLTDNDFMEISRYVLESAPFVSQLM